jgi:hypothetical protein
LETWDIVIIRLTINAVPGRAAREESRKSQA